MSNDVQGPRNRDLVLYLEELLESARRGEVQFFVASAAVLPFRPEGWGRLDVQAFGAFGALAPRLDETSLRGAYAKTLEGVAQAAGELNVGFEKLLERFAQVAPLPPAVGEKP